MFFSTATRPTIEEDRTGQIERRFFRARAEQLMVDAAGPTHEIAEAARRELALERRRGDHAGRAGIVEAPQQAVDEPRRDRRPPGEIFGKARMEAGGERMAGFPAPAADGEADRPLGDDVDGVGTRRGDLRGDLPLAGATPALFRDRSDRAPSGMPPGTGG